MRTSLQRDLICGNSCEMGDTLLDLIFIFDGESQTHQPNVDECQSVPAAYSTLRTIHSVPPSVISKYSYPGEKAAETRSSQQPTADRPPLLFNGTCRTSRSIFVISYVLASVANTPPVAGYRRHLSRRFVFSLLAAPTAPIRLAFLASPMYYRFHLDLDKS
jgi:hypothetical protein